jgi:hypothetical protein
MTAKKSFLILCLIFVSLTLLAFTSILSFQYRNNYFIYVPPYGYAPFMLITGLLSAIYHWLEKMGVLVSQAAAVLHFTLSLIGLALLVVPLSLLFSRVTLVSTEEERVFSQTMNSIYSLSLYVGLSSFFVGQGVFILGIMRANKKRTEGN